MHVETALPIIKSGWANAFDTTKGVWQIKINQDDKEYTDAVLDDTLLTPGVSIIPGTLEVFEGTWQLQGTSYKLVGQTDVTSQYLPQFIFTGTTFKLGLGHIPASKGLLVRFKTKISYTPLPGEKFENKGTLTENGDQDGIRPSSVKIRLFADGKDTGKELKLNAGNGWKGSFDGLPAFEGGRRIAYTVAEDAVEGYSSEVTGDASKGFTVTNTKEA